MQEMENRINYIIARVLSGEASLEDILYLGNWLNLSEKNKKEFEQIKNYWEAEVASSHASNPDLLLKKIRQSIHFKKKERKQLWRVWIPAAAVAIAITVSTLSLLYYSRSVDDTAEIREHYTYLTNDNKSCFTLNDGTKITLNKHSRLTFTDKYGKNNRNVKLEGEAFFEVANDPASPFEVAFDNETKDDVAIRVLGTVFNVRIDAGPERIIATLVEGSIRFESQEQKITMTPNQQLMFTYADKKIDIQVVDVEKEIAWKDGLLKYRTVSFTQLIEEVGKVYGIDIRIVNKELTDPSIMVTGTFDEKQSFEQILKVVSQSLPITWTKRGGVYYIK
jgi:ferric-dicitrate binding protein FerR (iron transport regulator)